MAGPVGPTGMFDNLVLEFRHVTEKPYCVCGQMVLCYGDHVEFICPKHDEGGCQMYVDAEGWVTRREWYAPVLRKRRRDARQRLWWGRQKARRVREHQAKQRRRAKAKKRDSTTVIFNAPTYGGTEAIRQIAEKLTDPTSWGPRGFTDETKSWGTPAREDFAVMGGYGAGKTATALAKWEAEVFRAKTRAMVTQGIYATEAEALAALERDYPGWGAAEAAQEGLTTSDLPPAETSRYVNGHFVPHGGGFAYVEEHDEVQFRALQDMRRGHPKKSSEN